MPTCRKSRNRNRKNKNRRNKKQSGGGAGAGWTVGGPLHPLFIALIIVIIVVVALFMLINSYCESCNATGICPINTKDLFDSFI